MHPHTFATLYPIFIYPGLAALLLSLFAFPPYISWLKGKQFGQFIRQEGPQSHARKAKTPTMGGLCFMVVVLVVAGLYLLISTSDLPAFRGLAPYLNAAASGLPDASPGLLLPALTVGVACGLLGLLDDLGKITSQSNRGLSARLRLLIEALLGILLAACLTAWHRLPEQVLFLHGFVHLGPNEAIVVLFVLAPFMVAATTNAFNLHDGMDGLAAGTGALVFLTCGLLFFCSGQPSLAALCSITVGAMLGFLAYNRYPARVFMGDTGSLFLGGLLAALVIEGGLVLWFIPLALLYIAEALSVMAQVSYFKLTKPYQGQAGLSPLKVAWIKLTRRLPGEGKRLLRMAPLHHHFEALASEHKVSEWQVVACFWLAQLLLCTLTLFCFQKTFLGR